MPQQVDEHLRLRDWLGAMALVKLCVRLALFSTAQVEVAVRVRFRAREDRVQRA